MSGSRLRPPVGNPLGRGPRHVVEAELRDQSNPVVRGQRLRALRDRREAITLDGTTAEPLGDTFTIARTLPLDK